MALLTQTAAVGYAQRRMPQPAFGDGPWGEAITYWLDQKKWKQADLLREIAAAGGRLRKTNKNTISNAARGFDCHTNTLRLIAAALNVTVDQVLVSPERRAANEERRRLLQDISAKVLQEMEARGVPVAPQPAPEKAPTFTEAIEIAKRAIRARKAENTNAVKKKRVAQPRRIRKKS